jgi:hypothetical protein
MSHLGTRAARPVAGRARRRVISGRSVCACAVMPVMVMPSGAKIRSPSSSSQFIAAHSAGHGRCGSYRRHVIVGKPQERRLAPSAVMTGNLLFGRPGSG